MEPGMPIVRLGKMPLKWCDRCDLPIVERKECGRCGGPAHKVTVTPPGDVRPAFPFDINLVREHVDAQFGEGCGKALIPEGRRILLNRCPNVDRMEEVIMGGRVIGALVFDLHREAFRFIPRMESAVPIAASGLLTRGWARMDAGAVDAIREGASSLAPGVLDAHPDICPGDEVIVLGPGDNVIAVGPARMSGRDMVEANRGVAVKSRWYGTVNPDPYRDPAWERTWEDVLEANKDHLDTEVAKAVEFIRRVVREYARPVAVSYSGGKDSLASLLLVLEAGIRPKVIFVDTGLELHETVENVHDVTEAHGLELIVEKAGDAFWEGLPMFGPPARDYRWCCKTCKLGPVSRLIKEHFPGGVLTFIGQRSYESIQRKGKGPIWVNPWVASQIGASPIQDWPALLIWIFLFSRTAEANPLYASGHARIGCWLCPATDMGDMWLLEGHPDSPRWRSFLREWAEQRGMSEAWLSKALWRWRRPPKGLKEFEDDFRPVREPEAEAAGGQMRLVLAEGYSPCIGGLSVEGAFSTPLNMDRVRNLLATVGRVEPMERAPDAVVVDGATDVFPEGAMVVRGKDEAEVNRRVDAVRRAVFRAMECVGCGVCLGRCEKGAISLVRGVAVIDVERCDSCGRCSKKCPVTDFTDWG